MTVAVVVPYRKRDENSERAWEYVQAHYATNHPDWQVVTGSCRGRWSKGKAIESALKKTKADRLVIADADSFTEAPAMRSAVESLDDYRWAMPHKTVIRLNAEATEDLYDGGPLIAKGLARPRYRGTVGGGLIVIRRDLYEELGGIDPRFLGWGGEDLTFGWVLLALGGEYRRFSGYLWHLWHDPETTNLRGSDESEALVAEYRKVANNPTGLRALIEERLHGTPDSAPDDKRDVATGGKSNGRARPNGS